MYLYTYNDKSVRIHFFVIRRLTGVLIFFIIVNIIDYGIIFFKIKNKSRSHRLKKKRT